MIQDENQLYHSIEALARMYRLRERETAETVWNPELQEDVIESTESMIRKIEREIAVYLANKYQLATREAEKVA